MSSKYIRWLLLTTLLASAVGYAGDSTSSKETNPKKPWDIGPDCQAKICSYLNARELLFYSRTHTKGRSAAIAACQLSSYVDSHDASALFLCRYFAGRMWPCSPKALVKKFASEVAASAMGRNSKEFYEEFLAFSNVNDVTAKHGESLRVLSASQQLASFLMDLVVWSLVRGQVERQFCFQAMVQVRDQVEDQVRDQVVKQVRDQVSAQAASQADQVKGQVEDQVEDQVGEQFWDQVGNRFWNQVGDQAKAQEWDQEWGQVWAQAWADLASFDLISAFQQGDLMRTLEPVIERALLTYHFAWAIARLSPESAKRRDIIAAMLLSKFGRSGEDKCRKILSGLMLTSPIRGRHLVLRWIGFLQQSLNEPNFPPE